MKLDKPALILRAAAGVTAPTWSDEELLAEMVHAHAAHETVDRAVAHHVAALRTRGVTWARIGGTLGMARLSAWERFSDEYGHPVRGGRPTAAESPCARARTGPRLEA